MGHNVTVFTFNSSKTPASRPKPYPRLGDPIVDAGAIRALLPHGMMGDDDDGGAMLLGRSRR